MRLRTLNMSYLAELSLHWLVVFWQSFVEILVVGLGGVVILNDVRVIVDN